MNNTKTQKLYADFPQLYREATSEHSMMKFGFDCNDGWFDLIYKLSADIEAEAKVLGLDPDSDGWPKAIQVKEKFGTLKFYCDAGERCALPDGDLGLVPEVAGQLISFRPVPSIQSIRALIREAESSSAAICEGCGRQGKMRKDGWWRVLCDDCEAERQKRKINDGSKYVDAND